MGLATLAGMAAGTARGLLAVHRAGDLLYGTWWLAWSRLAGEAVLPGLAGAGLGLVLALLPGAGRRLAERLAGRRWVRGACTAALLALAALAAWIPLEPVLGTLRAGNRPSVILVSLDTLRADRLMDAPGNVLMPRLRALVDEGTAFMQATAAAPWTLPSHASLFTSLLPFDHRAQWTRTPLGTRRLMLAELFRDAGYRTGAFTGAVYVGAPFGFAQGFEVYEDHDELKEGGSQGIFEGALAWVRRHRDAPFFLFVHTYEVHFPYHRAPDLTLPAGRLGPVFTTDQCEAVYRGDLLLTPDERRYVRALYDSDVRSADLAVGGFLEALRREGVLDGAILVVLSDHGEDLWDHVARRSPGHGHSLYEEMVRVPLAVRAPGRVVAGARLATPVSLLDVAPTLLDLCGLPPASPHQGRSLADSLRTGAEPAPRRVLAESVRFGPDRFALREGPLKVVLTPHPERRHGDVEMELRPVELYDLRSDPLERDPESARPLAYLAAVNLLVERAKRVLHPGPAEPPGTHALPDEVQEQLRSLGYVD